MVSSESRVALVGGKVGIEMLNYIIPLGHLIV